MRRRHGWLSLAVTCLFLTSPARGQSPGPQTWVISVGVDDYIQDAVPDLKFAGADAKLISQSFQTLSQVPASNIFTFTSDAVQPDFAPRATNIMHRVHWMKKVCKPGDTLVFFFAGHGLQMGPQSYLLTEESDNRSLATLKVSSLRSDELFEQMVQIPTQKILVVFDACRNESGDPALSDGLTAGLTLTRSQLEYATIFSCNVGERSWEWADRKHGFFTYHFAEGLRAAAADAQGAVSLQSLSEHLAHSVPASVRAQVKASQKPIFRYEGPGSSQWILTRLASKNPGKPIAPAEQARLVAQLDAARVQIDQVTAEKRALEDRLLLQQAESKKLMTRLDILERQSNSLPGGEALAAARDGAMRDAEKAQQGRSSSASDVELLQAEKEELRTQNQALLARIKVLELKLGKEALSASRSVRLASDSELQRLQQVEKQGGEGTLRSQVETLRREQELLLLDVPELAMAVAERVPQPPSDPKLKELQAKFDVYEESTRVLRQQLQTLEKALSNLARQKNESEARLRLTEANLAQSQAEVERLRAQLESLSRAHSESVRELVASRQQGEQLLERLQRAEERFAKQFPGVAFRSEYAAITRRIRVSDLMFQVEPNVEDSL